MVTGRARRVVVVLLVLWSLLLVRMTLWPQLATPEQEGWVRAAVAWFVERGVPITYLGLEAVANVLLFVPFGLLVALLLEVRRCLVVPAGLVLSGLIETTQLLALPDRVATVQDVVLNTLGAAVGWLVVATVRLRPAEPAMGRMCRPPRSGSYRACNGENVPVMTRDPEVGPLNTSAPLPAEAEATAPVDAPPTAQKPGRSLFGGELLYAAVLAVPLVASAAFAPVLTRVLGATEFGTVAAAISLNQLFVALALLGLDQAVLVQRGEDSDSRAARGLVAWAFVAVATTMGLALLTSPWWLAAFGFESRSLGLLALAWTAPNALVVMMTTLLLAEKRLGPFAILNLGSTVGGQVLSLVLVLVGTPSAVTYVWGMAGCAFVSTLVGIILTRPRWSGLRDVATTRRALALGLPLAVNAVAGYVLNAGDRLVIQSLLSPAQVGRYQAAYLVGNAVILVLYALGQSWIPRLVAVRNAAERMQVHAHSRDSLYRILAPAVLGVTLAAPWGLRILVPASFEPETLTFVVALIACAAFPVAAGGAMSRELLTLRRGRAIAVTTVTSAFVNIGLNVLLLPHLGIAGSALATLLSFMLQAGWKLLLLPREPRWPRAPWRVWLVVLGSSGAAIASSTVSDTVATMTVRLVLAVACVPWLLLELRRARD